MEHWVVRTIQGTCCIAPGGHAGQENVHLWAGSREVMLVKGIMLIVLGGLGEHLPQQTPNKYPAFDIRMAEPACFPRDSLPKSLPSASPSPAPFLRGPALVSSLGKRFFSLELLSLQGSMGNILAKAVP